MTARRVWWFSFSLFASVGSLWSLSIVPMEAPDEPAHTVKAAAVSHGHLNSKMALRGIYGVWIPVTHVRVPEGYARLSQYGPCWGDPADVPSWCRVNDQTDVTGTTYVGAYQPLYYAAVGWPSHLLAPRNGVRAMRLLSVAICAALFASGLTSAFSLKRRHLTIAGCALAITPMVLFLTGSINPNAMEIAAAFCLWASLVALVAGPPPAPTRLLVRACVAGILLSASRSLSPAFVMLIAGLALFAAPEAATLPRLWRERRVRAAAGVLLVGVVASVAFLVVNHTHEDRWRWPLGNDVSRLDVARESLEQTRLHVEEAVGVFGWAGPNEIRLPRGLTDAWILAIATLTAVAAAMGGWRQRLALAVALGASIALPVASELFNFPTTSGWQGRYILPIAIGLPILSGSILDRSERVVDAVKRPTVIAVVVGITAAYLVAHQTLMTHNTLGPGRGLLEALDARQWSGPLAPLTLFLLVMLASVGYAGWLVALASRRQT